MKTVYRLLLISFILVLILWKLYHGQTVIIGEQERAPKEVQIEIAERQKLPENIKVTVYYEALCSDSRNFIIKQLLPVYSQLHDYMTLDLVPYGKARTIESDDGAIEFECQHTATECLGNKIHSCVIDQITDQMLQLKIVSCMIDDGLSPLDTAEKCAHDNGVSYEQILTCTNGIQSSQLLKGHGVRTKNVRPTITFIPTIELDGTQKVPLPKLLKDFMKELCNSFETVPKECL